MKETEFKLLLAAGNVGFFESCEVTQLFLCRKKTNEVINLYTLVCFEDKPFIKRNANYLSKKLIPVNSELSLGIKRYWLSTVETEYVFEQVETNNKWTFDGDSQLILGELIKLHKQFIPGHDSQRLSQVLKNNFHNGSYIIEFFDEKKTYLESLIGLGNINVLEKVSDKISEYVPLNIALVRERMGNIIFQFPVTILNSNSYSTNKRDGIVLTFDWHKSLPKGKACFIQVDATLDKNYMGAVLENYNRENLQEINIGNIEQSSHIKIWNANPSMLLGVIDGVYLSGFNLNMGIGSHEPRIFKADDGKQIVSIVSRDLYAGKKPKVDYKSHILNTLYDADKTALEKNFAFKQYFTGQHHEALSDLRLLIRQNDEQGVYLWDPFLRAGDLLNTMFFSPTSNTELRAIGAISQTTKDVYMEKEMSSQHIVEEQVKIIEDPVNNHYALNLEFRIQHANFGYAFHDRFLIFPGGTKQRPKVYSLGTSVNSIGKSHHILQEISHPQRVIDAFNELWDKLNHDECLVWKYPKKS